MCKIRTSRLTYRELYRIAGVSGFPFVAFLKLFGRDLPDPNRYLAPCLWADIRIDPEALSEEVRRRVAAVHSSLPSSEGSWDTHFFRRPEDTSLIADSGGAVFFSAGASYQVTHIYVRGANGPIVNDTYVASYRQNGHCVGTTNNRMTFDCMPGSEWHFMAGSPESLIRGHKVTISTMSDIVIFHSFTEFTAASDRKAKLQAEWDFARGAYASVDGVSG